MSEQKTEVSSFEDLGLCPEVMTALKRIGYEKPSPIQSAIIPFVLDGRDVLGQAQTGTGKTAAFALPLLTRIKPEAKGVQALVLAPTRELAIQVAEALQGFAADIPGFHVLPIYGGQSYTVQLRQLRRGVQVVVGTPGRVMDHIRRGTLDVSGIQTLVLDEADEMLRMGFVDDVEWILEQTPDDRQIALFSATMPREIRRIAVRHLNNPEEVSIKVKTTTASTVRQRYWMVSGIHKLDALTRILEAEAYDGVIVFTRTRAETTDLAEHLKARGFAAEALNGDMQQRQREQTVNALKAGRLDVLIATDVAARGLDVERISHVINYDIPCDTEAYVHRIGRTGRAGREGDAILFVSPRERRMLQSIERATRQRIEPMDLPSVDQVNDKRVRRFHDRISEARASSDLACFEQMIEQYLKANDGVPLEEIAAALAKMVQGKEPFLLKDVPMRGRSSNDWDDRGSRGRRPGGGGRGRPAGRGRSGGGERSGRGAGRPGGFRGKPKRSRG